MAHIRFFFQTKQVREDPVKEFKYEGGGYTFPKLCSVEILYYQAKVHSRQISAQQQCNIIPTTV